MDLAFTDEEQKELVARPMGFDGPFTEEQFQIRLNIAKRISKFALAVDFTIGDEHRPIYVNFPLWGFYKQNGLIKRVFGVGFDEENNPRLQTATCFTDSVNLTVGGTSTEDVVRVDNWSNEDKAKIMQSGYPGVFLDPLGFWLILDSYHRQNQQ